MGPREDDRYRTRRDVSQVPLQGGYVAKRCPLRVQFDVLPPADVEPVPPSPGERLRMDAGNDFEAAVVAALRHAHPDAAVIDGDAPRDEQQAATVAALRAGAGLIIGGWLPDDHAGRRVGRPDLLVADPTTPGAYWPADVKHHRTVGRDLAELLADPLAPVVPLEALTASADQLADAATHRLSKADLFQLAHYHRMLEACGHGSPRALGAIIGKEGVVVWERLDVANVPQIWNRRRDAREQILERYDFEFSFRLDALAAALQQEPILEPVLVSECSSCPWRGHCLPRLDASDSTSLLPRLGYVPWHVLRRHGITTRRQLAELDRTSAAVVDVLGPSVQPVVAAASHLPAETPVAVVVRAADGPGEPGDGTGAEAEAEADRGAPDPTGPGPEGHDEPPADRRTVALAEHGLTTAGTIAALDPLALSLATQPIHRLADHIDQAWVATVGNGQPHLRRGLEELIVPGADVEIDIDMENGIDGTAYLWGALVDGRYVGHRSWAPTSRAVAAEVFASFWDWLQEQRQEAAADGRTIALYCWHQDAEAGALRAGAAAAADVLGRVDAPEEVEELLAGAELVDLLHVFRTQLLHGTGDSLKVVAPKAGFAWRDESPSGEDSMAWHLTATTSPDPAERAANQARLLAYNEDDVRATAAIRAWLRGLTPGTLPPTR